jgi:hypothetical protein
VNEVVLLRLSEHSEMLNLNSIERSIESIDESYAVQEHLLQAESTARVIDTIDV